MLNWLKRKGQQKIMASLIAKLLRYAITAAGGATVATSDDTLTQAAGAIVTIGGFAVSVYKDIRDARAAKA